MGQNSFSTARAALTIGIPLGAVMGGIYTWITFTASSISLLNWILLIAGVLYSIFKYRTQETTFWESFGIGSLTSAVASVIAGLMLMISLIFYSVLFYKARQIYSPSTLFFRITIFLTLLGVLVSYLFARFLHRKENKL